MKPREVYDLARRHLANSPTADPRSIAFAMAKEIPPHDRRDALAVALPALVRRVIAEKTARSAGAQRDNDRAGKDPVDPLALQVAVHAGVWKNLGDCNRDELVHMAAHRRQIVEEHLAIAAQYERLAEQLDATGAATVSDLSVRILTLSTGPLGRCSPSPQGGPAAARGDGEERPLQPTDEGSTRR